MINSEGLGGLRLIRPNFGSGIGLWIGSTEELLTLNGDVICPVAPSC